MRKSQRELIIIKKLENNDFTNFPQGLTPNAILEIEEEYLFPKKIDAIIYYLNRGSVDYSDFVEEFSKNGGDIDMLALTFLDEIGYPRKCSEDYMTAEDEQYMEFLLPIVCAGTDEVDIDEFLASVELLDADKKDEFYASLEEAGII